jgi:hypothetical protein
MQGRAGIRRTVIKPSTEEIPAGGYTLRIFGGDGVIEERKILIRK